MRFAGRPSEVTCVTVITRMVSVISLIMIVLMFSISVMLMVWSCREPGVNWERIEFQDIECWRRGQLWWKYIDYDYETHAIVSLYLPQAHDLFSSYRVIFFLKKYLETSPHAVFLIIWVGSLTNMTIAGVHFWEPWIAYFPILDNYRKFFDLVPKKPVIKHDFTFHTGYLCPTISSRAEPLIYINYEECDSWYYLIIQARGSLHSLLQFSDIENHMMI